MKVKTFYVCNGTTQLQEDINTCNKLQIQTWYQAGCNMIENPWKKVKINDVNEPT